jgi:hypothetical protein
VTRYLVKWTCNGQQDADHITAASAEDAAAIFDARAATMARIYRHHPQMFRFTRLSVNPEVAP